MRRSQAVALKLSMGRRAERARASVRRIGAPGVRLYIVCTREKKGGGWLQDRKEQLTQSKQHVHGPLEARSSDRTRERPSIHRRAE